MINVLLISLLCLISTFKRLLNRCPFRDICSVLNTQATVVLWGKYRITDVSPIVIVVFDSKVLLML